MERYYVANSSWFDTHPYDKRKIKAAVKRAGGKNVRESLAFGWSNQPEVVTFSAEPTQVRAIGKEVGDALGTQWILIQEKDW